MKRHARGLWRRVVGSADPQRTTKPAIGTDFLGVGFSTAAVALVAYELSHFIMSVTHGTLNNRAYLPFTDAAWGVVILALIGTAFAAAQYGGRMPTWVFIIVVSSLAIAVGFDLVDHLWPGSPHATPTAAIAVGSVMMALVTLRSSREIAYSTVVLGAVLFVACLTEPHSDPMAVAPDLAMLGLATIPPITAAVAVHWFRCLVDVELDRVLAHSAVSASRSGIGGAPSEELARLDLIAEDLLDGVASGRTPLPLDAATAAASAALATELRLHLIASRRETWLHSAIHESEFLSRSVSVSDVHGSAGRLDPPQRDALLSAVWLLISDPHECSPTVEVALGRLETRPERGARRTTTVQVTIVARGVPRRRVDPAIWDAFTRVGSYTDSSNTASVRVDIRCVVDNPGDA